MMEGTSLFSLPEGMLVEQIQITVQQSRREERLAHYEQVIALRKLGLSQAAIAQQVGIGASTVQSWLAAGIFASAQAA
jgi:DNA-directed RNA polymerase specialized sigma24 family protein